MAPRKTVNLYYFSDLTDDLPSFTLGDLDGILILRLCDLRSGFSNQYIYYAMIVKYY